MNQITERLINSIARPWETRFEPIVTRIREHVAKIEKTAAVGHMITSTKNLEAAHRLENGQTSISYGIQILSQGDSELLQEQQMLGQKFEKYSADVQAIRHMMEAALQSTQINKSQPLAVHSDKHEPITAVQERTIGNKKPPPTAQNDVDGNFRVHGVDRDHYKGKRDPRKGRRLARILCQTRG